MRSPTLPLSTCVLRIEWIYALLQYGIICGCDVVVSFDVLVLSNIQLWQYHLGLKPASLHIL